MGKWCNVVVVSVITWLTLQEVICQCDWNTDGFGYQNVKESDGSRTGFVRWQLVSGPLPGEVSPIAGIDGGNDCYFVAVGSNHNYAKARLLSPCYEIASTAENIALSYSSFQYREDGDAGILTAYWRPGCLQPKDLPNEIGSQIGFDRSGNQLTTWLDVRREIDINNVDPDKPFQIVFEALLIGEVNNTIAIDGIFIENVLTLTTRKPRVSATISLDNKPGIPASTQIPFQNVTFFDIGNNVTLDFCNSNLVIEGLDNCTFIGLMFAAVPLGLIFLTWLVCCTYNRYCRRVKHSNGRRRDDGDDSVSRDNYVSNTSGGYSYMNSMTENTIVQPTSPENTATKKKQGDVATSNNYEMDKIMTHHAHKYEKKVVKHHHTLDMDSKPTVDYIDSGGSQPQDAPCDHPYQVLASSEQNEQADDSHNGVDSSTSEKGIDDITTTDNIEEVSYHVLEEEIPPSPPRSLRPSQKLRYETAAHNNDNYETIATTNNDSIAEMLQGISSKPLVEPYADAIVGQHDADPTMGNESASPNPDIEPGYESLNEAFSPVRETPVDYGYDRPTYSAAYTPGFTVVDDNGNEDTLL